MRHTSAFSTFYLLVVFLVPINGKPMFPAFFTFGDSSLDVGCNNNLNTLAKANYSPYGRDFENHIPTGRFCNGKLTIDYACKAFLLLKIKSPLILLPLFLIYIFMSIF